MVCDTGVGGMWSPWHTPDLTCTLPLSQLAAAVAQPGPSLLCLNAARIQGVLAINQITLDLNQIAENFIFPLLFPLYFCFEILHRAQQWYYRALCKISKWLDYQNRRKFKFMEHYNPDLTDRQTASDKTGWSWTISWTIFHRNSNSMEISFCSHPSNS